jgi:hypothetical protein
MVWPCSRNDTPHICNISRLRVNRKEDIELVKKITNWNPTGLRTKGRPKNRWRDEVMNYLKKMK